MAGSRSLLDLFVRFRPDGNQSAIMERAIVSGPMLIDKESRMMEVSVNLPFYVPAKKIYELETAISQVYELKSLRIHPKFQDTRLTEEMVGDIMMEAKRRDIITENFLKNYRAHFGVNSIVLETGYGEGGVNILNVSDTAKQISAIIYEQFNEIYDISFQSNDEIEVGKFNINERLEQIKTSYSRPAEESAFTHAGNAKQSIYEDNPELVIEDGIVSTGYMKFDISNPVPLIGESFEITPSRLHDANRLMGHAIFVGEVINFEIKPRRRGQVGISFCIHDGNAALSCRINTDTVTSADYTVIGDGMCVAIRGELTRDDFDNELIIVPDDILQIAKLKRQDNAPEKRVELHLHTTMSAMDAIISPEELIETAKAWGHKAVAITDHGNVQAFQVAAPLAEKAGVKLIYGMESYFVNNSMSVNKTKKNYDFGDEFVVFDIETTGLSPLSCKIIEIGAVRIQDGETIETFSTFVDPGVSIPPFITQLTGIDDSMIKGSPDVKTAVTDFLKFAGQRPLIAHNASFDIGFIRKACEDYGIPFTNDYLDTVAISRFVNTDLKKHKLDIVADYFGIADFGHHRAYNDAEVTGQIFFFMTEKLKNEGIYNVFELQKAIDDRASVKKQKSYHQILLARNNTGLKNLYEIVSNGYLHDYYRHPRVSKSFLEAHREGLIVGSACEAGELFSAILENKEHDELLAIADFYDYLEIQPLSNNAFLINESESIADFETLKNINRTIVQLGEELHKPVVATCDAHVLDKHDEIHRKILLFGMKFGDADRTMDIYYRTTEEMLEEFSYLGEEKAYEVVVKNTNLIADMIEDNLKPFPEGTFTPSMEGAEEDLHRMCYERATSMYGDPLPEIVKTRLDKELNSIISHGFAVLYMIAQKLVKFSEDNGYLVGSRGSVGSSFVATMAGISEVNPLLPHYRCPKCRYTKFYTNGEVGSGFDLPDAYCPECGEKLIGDGHDIPFETFLGFHGDKSPDIDLNFSGEVQGKVHKYTEELFGTENVYRAGTIGEVASKTAYGFVMKYLDEHNMNLSKAEQNRLITKCVGVKRTTGQHPGGIVVVPKGLDVTDFCPVQHPADEADSDIITTHFTFEYLHDTLLKLDELGHDIPTKYKYIEKFSNSSVMDVPMNAPEVYELFQSTKPLNIGENEVVYEDIGTFGIPEMGTNFVMPVLIESKPKTFADLLQVSGLTHGTDVWLGNAQDLIKNNICTISKVVGTRDGIMIDLIRYGLDSSMAFKIMEFVRKNKKGKKLPDEMVKAMEEHNVDEWYIDSLRKIKYMFPKAHAAAYVMSAIRLGWYKIHDPIAFYAGFFSAAPKGFDSSIVMQGKKYVRNVIDDLKKKGRDASQKESDLLDALLLANEYLARGYEFLPVDLYKSDAKLFLPEDGKIRVPFSSLPGLGESAALSLQKSREDGPFISIDEIKDRASITKAVIEILKLNGVVDGLPETNQLTLF